MSPSHYWSASFDLLMHYKNVFSYHWKLRKNFAANFHNQQEAEFLPGPLSLQESPDSESFRWTARLLMVLVLCVLIWSFFGRIDIVVNAAGKVIPSMRTKTIASVDIASVRALHVAEGQRVRAGDLLIELDSSNSDAEHDKAENAAALARLQVARSASLLNAVRSGKSPQLAPVTGVTDAQWQSATALLRDQYADFTARRKRLEAEADRYQLALALAAKRVGDFSVLLANRDVSQHAWSEREQARVDLQGQLREARHQLSALIAQTLREARETMLDGQKTISAATQDMRRSGERSRLLRLTAPVDGVVQQLNVHTVGGVVPAAQALMQVVPLEAAVEVEAFLLNRDVGFVHMGQVAEVKVDAYDYTRYGTVSALVSDVSQDAIADEQRGLIYSTRVTLERKHLFVDGANLPLTVGMSVNVEIKTGSRRVIEYVLSPLMKHQREALHER